MKKTRIEMVKDVRVLGSEQWGFLPTLLSSEDFVDEVIADYNTQQELRATAIKANKESMTDNIKRLKDLGLSTHELCLVFDLAVGDRLEDL